MAIPTYLPDPTAKAAIKRVSKEEESGKSLVYHKAWDNKNGRIRQDTATTTAKSEK